MSAPEASSAAAASTTADASTPPFAARPPRRSALKRVALWSAAAFGGVVLLIAASIAWVLFVGVDLDAAPFRGKLADAFEDALGRPVRFEGPATLTVSAAPKLRVGGLTIGNPPGFDGDFASLGEARLALDLWPLLGKRLRVHELTGSDVKVRLIARADGRNNWTFGDGRPAPPPPPPDADAAARQQAAIDLAKQVRVDIGQIVFERVALEYTGANARTHFFDLDRLRAESQAGQPIRVDLQGKVQKTFPYTVKIIGGSLDALMRQTPDWPLKLDLAFLGTTLGLDAKLGLQHSEVGLVVDTPDLGQLEKLLQAEFPKVGATQLRAKLVYDPGVVAIRDLDARMGRTQLRGELLADSRGPRPKLSGQLDVPTLDLRPFLNDAPDDTEDPKSLADTYRNLSKATFSLKALRRADVDVTLTVGQWLSLPGDVRDASVQVRVIDGRLDVPIGATITGVKVDGALVADGTADPPTFGLKLGTRDNALGGLAELLAGLKGLDGRLGALDVSVAARGDQGSELAQSLDIRIGIRDGRLTYGNAAGGRPVEFTLARFDVTLPPGKPLTGALDGTLLGQPITATLATGSLEQMALESKAPLDFALRSGPVRASVKGVLAAPTEADGTQITFALDAPRTAEVARWLGLRPGADAKVSIAGRARAQGDVAAVEDLRIQLGRSEIRAALARVTQDGRPLLRIKLDAPLIDAQELQTLLPPPTPPAARAATATTAKAAPSKPVLDIPILPRGLDLTDADIDVDVRELRGPAVTVRDLAFDGRIRDGHMDGAPFSVSAGGIGFRGAVSFDLRGEPKSALWLSAADADIGAVLHALNLARNVDAKVAHLALHLDARASLLGEMLAKSRLAATVEGGYFAIRDANTGGQVRVELASGTLKADPGEPIRLDLDGEVDDTPVKIGLATASAVELVRPGVRIPLTLTADTSETSLRLEGSVDRAVENRDVELKLAMRGTRFDRLSKLARASLPPWGPWQLGGRFRMSTRGYAVDDLRFQVADSVLTGRGSFVTAGTKPRIDIALRSPRLQLDDFRLGDWSATGRKPDPAPEKKLSEAELRAKARDASKQAQALLSREVLERQDALLTVRVDEVLSGRDRLGSGRLDAKLENGRADIGPVEVNIPDGGVARAWLGYEPTERDVKVDLRVDAVRFDYGVLARHFKPDAAFKGTFSLGMDVQARAPQLADVLKAGNGRIDFALWPTEMSSGLIDLWAVNVLSAITPQLDKGKSPKINCAVGQFALTQGKLEQKQIVLDTTRMRVTGTAQADFDTERLALVMVPQPKTPQFLSLATPVQVTGTFTKFEVGVPPGGILGTLGRMATSIFWVPVAKLMAKDIPADGRDVCDLALAATSPAPAEVPDRGIAAESVR